MLALEEHKYVNDQDVSGSELCSVGGSGDYFVLMAGGVGTPEYITDFKRNCQIIFTRNQREF